LRWPLLQFLGGLLLIWIAVKLVWQDAGVAGEEHQVRQGTSLLQAIWIIIVADVVMSLDNVLAIASIGRDHLGLVVFGIGLSIPIVVFGSAFLAWLMGRFGWIIWLGGGILGYYAGKLIFEDPWIARALGHAADVLHYPVPLALAVALAMLGWVASRRQRPEGVRHDG
jgi:YjbE family integral membrane protein